MSGQRTALWTIALLAIIAAVGYRVSVMREPPPPPAPRLVFVTGGSGPYWQATVSGAQAAARDLHAELQVKMPEQDENLAQQMEILTHLNRETIDGIALSPLDAEGQTRYINQLARDTRVVTYDSDAPLSERQSHVGTSNFAAGLTCARLVNEAIPDGGKVAVLLASVTEENVLDRKNGFQERLSAYADDVESGSSPKFTIVGFFEDNGRDDVCVKNIKEALAKDEDIACFVGLNARHGPILVKTLKELGKLDQIKLVTFDTPDETLDAIADGHIYATIAQDPYKFGYEAVKILCTLCNGHETELPIVGKGSVYVSAEPIQKDNLEAFRAKLQSRQGTKSVQPKAGSDKQNAA
jgi:ribose transport system substrate-binding protein